MLNENFTIGQIVNTHGIKGQVKVYPYTDDLQRFKKYKKVDFNINGKLISNDVESVAIQNNMLIIKFKGIDSIEEANKLRNIYISINRAEANPLNDNEYYISDLIGLKVYDEDNSKYLGDIIDIIQTGSNDVYIVKDKSKDSEKEILLPAIEDVIKEINIKEGYIKVHLLEGLI